MGKPNHLGYKIKMLNNALTQNMTKGITSLDLTCSQSFILRYLVMHQDAAVYSRDLEKNFDFSHPTVSGLLQRLEAKGFVVCAPDPADRRLKRITVTEKALKLNQEIRAQIEASEQALVAGFTEEEVQTLNALLDRVIQNTVPSSAEGGCAL